LSQRPPASYVSGSGTGTLAAVGTDFATPVWRALIVLRVATLAYGTGLVLYHHRDVSRPVAAGAALGAMALWTLVISVANARPRLRRWPWILADLAVASAALLFTAYVDRPGGALLAHGLTLTGPWTAPAVLACAILGGPWVGLAASLVIVAATIALPGGWLDLDTLDNLVLLVLAAGTVGWAVRLLDQAQRRMRELVEREAATAERDRLARSIHDGVLQLLALVQHHGPELGGRGAELARLAGAQEASLRALMTGDREASLRMPGSGDRATGDQAPDGRAEVDLRAALGQLGLPAGHLSVPATPVRLPARTVAELTAATVAALDNARRHAGTGARAWVAVEDEGDAVIVVVRDDGTGIPEGRLAEAAAAGRLGVAQSIRGRLADLGGTATLTSRPGEGTEVECRVPR
jgi:signal transduction histidine kinase